jgi:cellulose biosynthesis protein BcsQ
MINSNSLFFNIKDSNVEIFATSLSKDGVRIVLIDLDRKPNARLTIFLSNEAAKVLTEEIKTTLNTINNE